MIAFQNYFINEFLVLIQHSVMQEEITVAVLSCKYLNNIPKATRAADAS